MTLRTLLFAVALFAGLAILGIWISIAVAELASLGHFMGVTK